MTRVLLLVLLPLTILAPALPLHAQIRAELPGGRRSTTVESLSTYPVFHHLQAVRVRGKLVTDGVGTSLLGSAAKIHLIGDAALGSVDGEVEVLGAFIDVGRLPPDDPRVAAHQLVALSQKVLNRDWPAQGELLAIITQEVTRAEPFTAITLRALALEPGKYEGQAVTVSGRFRGRNLFGDQPAAPGRSRFDFILQLADASIWVVGRQARADGVDLRVDRRVETGRWLEVRGDVRMARGLAWIEAIDIKATTAAEEEAADETAAAQALQAPAPTVVFSSPTTDEFDVRRDAHVRIQFSRDMVADSFRGAVQARYVAREAAERGEPQAPSLTFTIDYDGGRRVLQLNFREPLERFRTVEVQLGAGIVATDKQPLTPWTLRFTVGG